MSQTTGTVGDINDSNNDNDNNNSDMTGGSWTRQGQKNNVSAQMTSASVVVPTPSGVSPCYHSRHTSRPSDTTLSCPQLDLVTSRHGYVTDMAGAPGVGGERRCEEGTSLCCSLCERSARQCSDLPLPNSPDCDFQPAPVCRSSSSSSSSCQRRGTRHRGSQCFAERDNAGDQYFSGAELGHSQNLLEMKKRRHGRPGKPPKPTCPPLFTLPGYLRTPWYFVAAVLTSATLLHVLPWASAKVIRKQMSGRVITTRYGKVRGILVEFPNRHLKPVEAFFGLKYADLEKGNMRFMPPKNPKEQWAKIRAAVRQRPSCPQLTRHEREYENVLPEGRLAHLRNITPFLTEQIEDCLTLNLYVPIPSELCVGCVVFFCGLLG